MGADSRQMRLSREIENWDKLICYANRCLDPPAARLSRAGRMPQLHACGSTEPLVAAGLQRADPRARRAARAAPVRPHDAQRGADRRGAAVRGVRAPRAPRSAGSRDRHACPRGAAPRARVARAAAFAGRRLAAAAPGGLPCAPPGHPARRGRRAVGRLHRARTRRPRRPRAGLHARRHIRVAHRTFLQRPLSPGVPARPSAGAAAPPAHRRRGRVPHRPAVAREQRAPPGGGGGASAPAAHGDGTRPTQQRVRHASGRLRREPGAGARAVPFPPSGTFDPADARAEAHAADLRRAPARSQPVDGRAGLVRGADGASAEQLSS